VRMGWFFTHPSILRGPTPFSSAGTACMQWLTPGKIRPKRPLRLPGRARNASYALLIFGKSNQLTLSSASSDTVLAVSKEYSSVEVRDTRRFLVSMSRNDLEFIVSYLLAWYRDGFAEVNHIDLELSGAEDCGRNCTLVVRAEASRYPMNGEEAQRMLRELK
jgi:hypothetical protein